MIRISCSGCDSALKIPLRLAGTTGNCPRCKTEIQIPAAPQAEVESPAEAKSSDKAKSLNQSESTDAAFDPMDVLGAPAEPSPAAQTKPPGPAAVSSSVQAKPEDNSEDTHPAPPSTTGTAAAALDAMSAMQNRTPGAAQSAQPGQLSEPSAATEPRNIREAVADNIILYLTFALCVLATMIAYLPKGCDPGVPRYPVTGRVVFSDGTPVRTGVIEFESVELQLSATARINEDGSFTCPEGAPAGASLAIVTQMIISDGTIRHEKDHGKPVGHRFRRYETSGLKFNIDATDMNEFRVVVEPEANLNTEDDSDN